MTSEIALFVLVCATVGTLVIAVIGAFAGLRWPGFRGIFSFLLLIGFLVMVFFAIVAIVVSYDEQHSLLLNLREGEPRLGTIAAIDEHELCVVLDGKENDLCVSRSKVMNLLQSFQGAGPVLLKRCCEEEIVGEYFTIRKVRVDAESGVILTR